MMAMGITGPPQVNEDLTFEANTAPGQMVIRAFVRGPASTTSAPWVVKAVRHDSTDITDKGIDLSGGRSIDGVEVVLTNRVQEVSGQVTDSRMQVVTDVTVMIFAQDKDHWDTASRYQAFARPDQNGRYAVRTLPPGDYYAIALQQIEQSRRGDPAYYEQFVSDAVRFTLTEAETRALDLKLTVPR
jgi:hypothetical protein